MASLEEGLSEQFYRWELRGRGREVWPGPVALEPPFRPFFGHYLPSSAALDDGRRPTVLSSWVERFLGTAKEKEPADEDEEEPEAAELFREPVVELTLFLPANAHFRPESFQAFLDSLPALSEPLTFEVYGNCERVVMQFTASQRDLGRVKPLLAAHFPAVTFQALPSRLATVWTGSGEKAVVNFGLGREFMLPLATHIADPLVSLCGALQGLAEDELGMYQILFQPVRHRWDESIIRAVSRSDGQPFFVNAAELVSASERKVSCPLFSTVVRLATQAKDIDRAWDIATNLSGALRLFQNPDGNHLIPLSNEEYPYEEHAADVVRRQSRRCGMLLNTEELSGFVHLPTAPMPVLSAGLRQSKAAPDIQPSAGSLVLGINEHLGESCPVILTQEQRFRHVQVIGATGTGKSTLLFNLIRQDIEQGHGIGVLDPHGDLIDRILGIIPEDRKDDVIVFDPSDPTHTVGFNLLSAHSDAEKALLASDLVSVFERHSTSWGDQMNSVLRNGVMAFLESSRGGTLLDLRRFLLEPDFRTEFLTTVTDSEVLYYWQKAFTQLSGNKSLGPILTRLDTFLSPKPVRHALAMQHGKLDFGKVMDTGKIFLAKLPQGLIGKTDTYLLGALLVGKFQQLAMARQSLSEEERRPFHLVIDEFHHFMTPSMAEILNGARKYRLGLTLAHQELRQLPVTTTIASPSLPPRDLGRGGAQHQTIQKRLKEAAENLGYLVTTEKPVLDRTGSIDLALESSRRSIAVEITVTTTIDHEVGNVLKGLKAGFQSVAVVSGSETKLAQMREAVTASLGAAEAVNVGYFTPDQFIEHLQSLAKGDLPVPAEAVTQRRGFKVTRSAPKLSPEELKAKEAAALRMIADSMKRKP